jgi:hypothetical protein
MAKKRRTKKQKIKIKKQIAASQQEPLTENTAEKTEANSLVIKDWLKTTWVSLLILAVLGAAYWWLNH